MGSITSFLVLEVNHLPTVTDWIMVAITFVYVIATFFICVANFKAAKATREQTTEMKRQSDEAKRLEHMPYLAVSFEDREANDKRNQIFPDLMLDVNRGDDRYLVSSCKTICVTNIGLGLAVNLFYQWRSGEILKTGCLSSSVIEKGNCCRSESILSASLPNMQSQSADATLTICFDDLLGNHYEQGVELSFQINPYHLCLVQFNTLSPRFFEG